MDKQEEAQTISEAMRILGSRTTDLKAVTSAENIREYHKQPRTEEYLEKLRAGQARRRQREAEQKQAQGLAPATSEKRGVGRPRSTPVPAADAPKRGRGRPPKPKPEG